MATSYSNRSKNIHCILLKIRKRTPLTVSFEHFRVVPKREHANDLKHTFSKKKLSKSTSKSTSEHYCIDLHQSALSEDKLYEICTFMKDDNKPYSTTCDTTTHWCNRILCTYLLLQNIMETEQMISTLY